MLLNPTLGTAVCIWHGTNTVTQLEDMYFTLASGGSHPTAGGRPRAFYITNACRVVYPDAERGETKKTMMGIGGTVNGTSTATAGGDSTTKLTDSTAAFDSTQSLAECYLHILSGTNKGLSRKISTNTGTVITCAAFPAAVPSGVRYTVSPIPVRLRLWPLGLSQDIGYPRYIFRRWLTRSIAVHLASLAGEYAGVNGLVTVGAYRRLEDSMAVTADITMAASAAECYGPLSADGLVLEPGVEIVAANVDFELIAVQIEVNYTKSKKDG
jgi:hypothetical protein